MNITFPRSRPDFSKGIDVKDSLRIVQVSAEDKARFAKMKADADAMAANSAKANAYAAAVGKYENHDVVISGPTKEDATPELAKQMLDRVKVMVAQGDTRGTNFSARWGDRVAHDVKTYMSWLQESISLGQSLHRSSGTNQTVAKPTK